MQKGRPTIKKTRRRTFPPSALSSMWTEMGSSGCKIADEAGEKEKFNEKSCLGCDCRVALRRHSSDTAISLCLESGAESTAK